MSDGIDLLLARKGHHLLEGQLPGVHLDHLDARDDLVHHPHPFVCPQGGPESQHRGPLSQISLQGDKEQHEGYTKHGSDSNL